MGLLNSFHWWDWRENKQLCCNSLESELGFCGLRWCMTLAFAELISRNLSLLYTWFVNIVVQNVMNLKTKFKHITTWKPIHTSLHDQACSFNNNIALLCFWVCHIVPAYEQPMPVKRFRNLIGILVSINRFVLLNSCGLRLAHCLYGTLAKANPFPWV